LYPSIIRSLNLGIETLKGRIVDDNQNYNCWNSMVELKERNPEDILTVEKLDKKTYTLKQFKMPVGDLIEMIEENEWTISANGTFFDTKKQSIAAEVLTDWFRLRQEYKKEMKIAFKAGNSEKGELYDLKQYCVKILLNSLYGGYAINGWRFTDGWKMCSSATTTTGQRLLQESIRQANIIINNDYEF